MVNITGGPATLTWNNSAGGNGTDWDVQNQQNWTSSASSDPNRFYQDDVVNFTDSNNNHNTVNIAAAVQPLGRNVHEH